MVTLLKMVIGKGKGKIKELLQDNNLLENVKANPLNPVVGGVLAGGTLIGGTVLAVNAVRKKRKKQKRKTYGTRKKGRRKRMGMRKTLTKRQRYVRKIKRRPGRQTPYTAGARKDRSRTRIRYTKNGQPYNLTGKGGRAKFIKKRRR